MNLTFSLKPDVEQGPGVCSKRLPAHSAQKGWARPRCWEPDPALQPSTQSHACTPAGIPTGDPEEPPPSPRLDHLATVMFGASFRSYNKQVWSWESQETQAGGADILWGEGVR